MNQPKLPDGPQVPLMVEGVIDRETLSRLFADLATAATLIGIREKGGPREYGGAEALDPAIALNRMLTGAARAVQIRYRFDGHEWTDTVMTLPAGFRVVRCRHDG